MRARRWVVGSLLALVVLLLVAATAAVLFLPRVARTVAIWRLQALTQRAVTIDALDISLRTGRFSVRGFRVNDPDGGLLARFDSLEGRFHRRSIWQGHLWIEDLVLTNGDVRIVRVGPDRFNISDLLERPREPSTGFTITVDHFAVHGGSVVLEDRVLEPARTWRSENIALEARNITTRAAEGVAYGSTTVAGALVTVRVSDLRLFPIHLHADVNVRDLDLTLADLYLPPRAPTAIESGVAHAAIGIDLDARDGLALNAEGVVERLTVGRPDIRGDEVTSPSLRFLVRELRQRPGMIGLRYASLEGDVTMLDPTTSTRLTFKDVTATASDLEQPMKSPAKIAVYGTLPGVGEIDVSGTAGIAPRRLDVRVRARSIDLPFLSRHLPFEAVVMGTGSADVRVVATQDKTLAVNVTGDLTLDKVRVKDGDQTPVEVKRVNARGLDYTYPATIRVSDLTLTEPATQVERSSDGTLNLAALARRRETPDGAPPPASVGAPAPSQGSAPAVDLGVTRLSIVNGRARVNDAVTGGRLDATNVDLTAENLTWPSRGPARVRLATNVAGGQIGVRGTVEPSPARGNLVVTARKVDISTVQPWLPPTVGRLRGHADADLTVGLALQPLDVEAKGTVTGSSLVWSDGVHPAVDVANLDVRAEDVTWPSRGPAKVRVVANVAGGRVRARGTVDAGTRRAELAIKASGVNLAMAQPWLPIVGQVRGAADADVSVAIGMDPFTLALKGGVGAGDLAFLEGTKPLLTVKRVDATGLDVVWPTKVAIDRLRVNTPWAEIARNRSGELSLRAIFRRRPELPPPAAPAPDAAAAATPGAPPPNAGPLPGMQVSLREAIFENGGSRIIDDSVEPAARFELAGSRLELRNLTWPARGNAALVASTPMPGGGTLSARGTFSIEPTRLALDAQLDQVDLAPGRPYLPFDARMAGKLTGKAKITGTFDDTIRLVIEGDAGVDRLRLGDPERRLVTADKVDLAGFRYSYPTSVRIRQVTLDKPWVLVERRSDGALELVALFKAKQRVPPAPAAPAATPAVTRASIPPADKPRAPSSVRVVVNTLLMRDGFIRFVDRTTDPAYAEELSQVSVVGENLGTTPTRPGAAPRRGTVELRGQFASGTPLAVHGKIGSYPGPLFLDVVVELTDFPVPRLNPYLDRLSSYVAKQGTLTATLSYRVNDDDLDAVNDVRIDGLDLEAGGRGGEFRKRTGLPLDTLVSLLKDRKGVIKLNIPVHGQLSSPEFEYGEAVWAALRNLTIKLVALPFSLVGKLFFTEDSRIESVQIDPVTFQTAKPVPDRPGAEQITRLATFLKETPEVRLRLRPVTTVTDVTALRREALESRLATLGADEAARRQAAVGLYTELFPRRDPPSSDEALYEALTRETPTPPRALRQLADGRVAAVQNALVAAGIPADRLERLESRTAVESEGAARVEFEIGTPKP